MKFSYGRVFYAHGKKMKGIWIAIFFIYLLGSVNAQRSNSSFERFFVPADSFSNARFYGITGTGTAIYIGASVGLYGAWYKQYPLTSFHFFNDWGEWQFMDKTGHFYTSWFQGYLVNSMIRWSGAGKKEAIWSGIIAGSLFQSTIEVMDGFSEKWGFSATDIGANLLGTSLFAVQQMVWDEQKLLVKFSSYPTTYSQTTIVGIGGGTMTLDERAKELYGTILPARVLKDYNAQTCWISFSPEWIFGNGKFPDWLNLAIGYSSENIFGGFDNAWTKDGIRFELTDPAYNRYHQVLIAPDINWDKVHTDSPFLKSLLRVLNILKVPAPALELNDRDGVRVVWHWIYF